MADFATTHARTDDVDTSHKAAERAESTAMQHKARVYAALKLGAFTSQQIAQITGLEYLQVVRRVSDLRNEGAIVDSGERRPTISGRLAAVWKLKPAQLEMFVGAP